MRTIYKYRINPQGEVQLPFGAKILTIQTQRNEAFIWAEVTDNSPETVKFSVFGTGHIIPDAYDGEYIGTFQLGSGALVFHAYKDKEKEVS